MGQITGRSTTKSYVDLEIIQELIVRNGLRQLDMSAAMYGGNCPFCGHDKCFTLWSGTGAFRCFWCGADGRFVRTPERVAAKRLAERARIKAIQDAAW